MQKNLYRAVKRASLYNVMTAETKEVLINLRVKPEVREAFRLAAQLRGATMSGLLHQFIFRTVREEKERDPEPFNKPAFNKPEPPANGEDTPGKAEQN
jgi:hypothetical protein